MSPILDKLKIMAALQVGEPMPYEKLDWDRSANWGQQLSALAQEAVEEIERLQAQLPEGMKDCTIVYKRCEKGHGWLTATNWVQHECPTCERDRLRAALEPSVPPTYLQPTPSQEAYLQALREQASKPVDRAQVVGGPKPNKDDPDLGLR